MTITALAPWYGGNRMLGGEVGKLLAGCEWVGVPFMGGGPELRHIRCRTGVANDLHRHVVNLAAVAGHAAIGPQLYRRLRRQLFHPDILAQAQAECLRRERDPLYQMALPMEPTPGRPTLNRSARLDWAVDYFVCCWMGRSGQAGTPGEFRGKPAFRWEAGGGDSVVRFQSAVKALRDWRAVLSRWTFTCIDAFDFLAKCKDRDGHGIYCDAPWPDDGDGYTHGFPEVKQRQLATVLADYRQARVVVRYGDHPLIRELYPKPHWRWVTLTGRTAANKAKAEVFLVSRAGGP